MPHTDRARPVEPLPTGYEGLRFGNRENLGIGLYRNDSVCYGEGPTDIGSLLLSLNHHTAAQREEKIKIDSGLMLIATTGNPTHFGFTAFGYKDLVTFTVFCKSDVISRASIQGGRQHPSGINAPFMTHEYRDIGLGVFNILVGARIARIYWDQNLRSAGLKGSDPTNRSAWKYFEKRGAAHRESSSAGTRFVMTEEIGSSDEVGTMLRTALKLGCNESLKETEMYGWAKEQPRMLSPLEKKFGPQPLWIDWMP